MPKPNLRRPGDEREGAIRLLHGMTKIAMTSHRLSALSAEPAALERADFLEGESSPEKVVVAYHERTKHHFHRYAAAQGFMDWATQPDPFRRYAGADRVRLPLPKTDCSLHKSSVPFCAFYVRNRMSIPAINLLGTR